MSKHTQAKQRTYLTRTQWDSDDRQTATVVRIRANRVVLRLADGTEVRCNDTTSSAILEGRDTLCVRVAK